MNMFRSLKQDIFLLIFLFTTITACDSNRLFEENRVIPNKTWSAGNKVSFQATITDTALTYNVYLNIRNTLDYPYSNLFLFLQTTFPDGHKAKDTLECLLADYDGRWLGSGVGSVKFNRFLLKKGVSFREKGVYRFDLEQAMRVPELKGIEDVGLRIEK